YIDDLTTKSVREGEAYLEAEGAVRFMSIHASKGLEFPIVVLAHASSGLHSPDSNPMQIDPVYGLSCKVYSEEERKFVKPYLYADAEDLQKQRDAAEKKRLLYVAMTRARDRLILAGDYNEEKYTAQGWMGDILELLADEPSDNGIIPYTETGHIALNRPLYDTDMMQQLSAVSLPATGDISQLSDGVEPIEPPLIAVPELERAAFMGHIAATSLADLGWYMHERNAYQRRKIRREALHDAPGRIYDVVRDETPHVTQRMIGNIMHEALRYWRFPSSTDELTATLEAYIWQQHITDENLVVDALERTRELLTLFQQTEMYQWIDDARRQQRPMYPEMPFIYRTDKRIIHGIIDMLFQRADGTWIVLDYKTSYVPDYYDNREEAVQKHVKRYQLQVGAYAAAVMEQLNGVIPDVYVHYLRYNHSVRIPAEIWQTELQKLEQYIGQVINYDAS
ncbi:MAG: 3'-5' exonuclease, partial [Aggregatilineales bacterium]